MDPTSPKFVPGSPSKIPRRRPSASSFALPPSPTKSSYPWQNPLRNENPEDDSNLQDRRRTATRTRTRSADLSTNSASNEATSLRKLPPLSIHIPEFSPQPPRNRSISASTSTPTQSSSSFAPRSRQPSHSQLYHSQSLRTPRSSHFSNQPPPPMSERPRISSHPFHPPPSSDAAAVVVNSPVPARTPRDRSGTTTNTSTLATPATYESFDFPLPAVNTPAEERDVAFESTRWWCCGLARLSSRHDSLDREEEDKLGRVGVIGERTRLLSNRETNEDQGSALESDVGKETGRWGYVWGEVVCYAKHMLPPIILFVVVVLVIALFAYKQAIRRIIDDRFPPTAEEP